MKLTITAHRVLRTFLEDPEVARYGLELMKITGLPSGTLYPLLARFEKAGWLRSEREGDPPAGRPARRFYVLTPSGVQNGRLACAELHDQLRPLPQPVQGNAGPQVGLS